MDPHRKTRGRVRKIQTRLKLLWSFNFEHVRMDDALRTFFGGISFRLPGGTPVTFMITERLADHWSVQNGDPFAAIRDAALVLTHAVIMHNTDQHNRNVRKQSEPMTLE
jgi:brefeldin A-resistance guanine nucleotide exchange factor 1